MVAVARVAREQVRRVDRLPAVPLLITDGIEVTIDAVWVWTVLPAAGTFLLEDDDLTHSTLRAAAALSSLIPAGAEFHLKSVHTPHHGDGYRRSWDTVTSDRAPRAASYIDLGVHRIDRGAADGVLRRRVVLLGVRWPDPTTSDTTAAGTGNAVGVWWRRWNPTPPSREASIADARHRLEAAAPGIRRWLTAAARSDLRAASAGAGLIAWAYARELRRTPIPVPDGEVLTTASLVHLGHGHVDPTRSDRYVVVTDLATGTRTFLSILVPAAVTGFPTAGVLAPGSEWLRIAQDLPGVEVSVRGVNHGQVGSRRLLEHAARVARSQVREAQTTGNPASAPATEADEVLQERLAEVAHRDDVEVTVHARWVITADDPDVLADRVGEVRQRYDGIVDLHLVGDVKDLLWRELLPGDEVRVPEFGADQPMRTLAGGWLTGGASFGDPTGPYVGVNLGTSADPVQLHLASRADADRKLPTTVVFTGLSGSGKSTALNLFVLGLLAEAAWVLLPDVKGDLGGIVPAARQLLGVTVQEIDATDPGCAGMMDPMRFAPTADDARTLTMDALIGALTPDDRAAAETILETAIDTVLRTPRDSWSTPAVIRHLLGLPDDDPTAKVGHRLGRSLEIRARSPQLRALAGELPGREPLLRTAGLVYLRLDGLDFPYHTTDVQLWTVPQRCSMATMRVALAFALHQSRQVRQLKKAVALPELHLLTRYPEGRQFVDWLCRVGRALQTFVLLDSQSALDLAQIPALVEQIVMAFCFRATTTAEQDAQGTLIGRPHPGPELRAALTTLGTGQCVAMDRHRRLTTLEFDRLTTWLADTLNTDPDNPDRDHTDRDDTVRGNLDGRDLDGLDGGGDSVPLATDPGVSDLEPGPPRTVSTNGGVR
jgi:hypothetical protein